MALLESLQWDNGRYFNKLAVRTLDRLGNHLIRKYELRKVRKTDLPGEPNVSLPRTGGSSTNGGPPAGFPDIP